MKNTFLGLSFFIYATIYSQFNDSVAKRVNKYHFFNIIASFNQKGISYQSTFLNTGFAKKQNNFFVYNRNTGLTDRYRMENNGYYAMTSFKNVNQNPIIIEDSFNPYGTNNLALGLIMGVLGEVLTFNFKIK